MEWTTIILTVVLAWAQFWTAILRKCTINFYVSLTFLVRVSVCWWQMVYHPKDGAPNSLNHLTNPGLQREEIIPKIWLFTARWDSNKHSYVTLPTMSWQSSFLDPMLNIHASKNPHYHGAISTYLKYIFTSQQTCKQTKAIFWGCKPYLTTQKNCILSRYITVRKLTIPDIIYNVRHSCYYVTLYNDFICCQVSI